MTRIPRWRRKSRSLTAFVLCAFVVTACHSQKRIAISNASDPSATPTATTPLKVGDQVRITLRNGDEVRFTVAEVQADALLGNTGRRVLYSDMQSLERRHLSKIKTGVILGLLVLWVLAIIGLANGGGIPTGVI